MAECPLNRALIQPTGNEILAGIVEDTDSPMIRTVLEGIGLSADIAVPVVDEEGRIEAAIRAAAREGCALLVLIGGSGGGHRFDPTLSQDFTHTTMDRILTGCRATALYGKNGHLWSRLVCGWLEDTLVVNVPGPYREAKAAIEALAPLYKGADTDTAALNAAMAEAVCATYG